MEQTWTTPTFEEISLNSECAAYAGGTRGNDAPADPT